MSVARKPEVRAANGQSAIRQSAAQKTKIENVIFDDAFAEGTFRIRSNVGVVAQNVSEQLAVSG